MPNCIWINMSSCNDISFLDMPISLINSEVGISISLTKTLHNFSLSLSCSSWAKFNNRYPNSYKAVNRCLSAVAFLLTMIKGVVLFINPLNPSNSTSASRCTTLIPFSSRRKVILLIASSPSFKSFRNLQATVIASFFSLIISL